MTQTTGCRFFLELSPECNGVGTRKWMREENRQDTNPETSTFGPNRLVLAGYGLSLVAVLVLVAALVWPRRRREGRETAGSGRGVPRRCRAPRAVDAAFVGPAGGARRDHFAGLALGFVFAARATPIFVLLVFVVLYRGIGARPLALAGGAILAIAVPILTILIRPENRGGYNPEYSADRIVVHWGRRRRHHAPGARAGAGAQ